MTAVTSTVKLAKGQKVDLTKSNPGLRNILVGLGWDERTTDGKAFDLDAIAVCLNADAKAIDLVYYNALKSKCNAIVHSGDNRTGAGDNDDEFLTIDLANVSDEIVKIVIATSIHEAETNGVTFGQVCNAFVRVVNMGEDLESVDDDTEMLRYDLSEDASTETVMILGEIYRHNGEWKFGAVGQGFNEGLPKLLESYGLEV